MATHRLMTLHQCENMWYLESFATSNRNRFFFPLVDVAQFFSIVYNLGQNC